MKVFRREYKAYPGIMGYAILLPWSLPYIIGCFVILRMLLTGEIDKSIVGLVFVGLLVGMPPFLLFWVIVFRTSLILSDEGLMYRGIKMHRWNIFKSKAIEISTTWDRVKNVRWAGAPKAKLVIETDQDEIEFWVMFHPSTNAQIMQDISRRLSHDKN